MYCESQFNKYHPHAKALATVLGVGIRVVCLDRGEFRPEVLNFPDDYVPPTVILLYRPGHYDILYYGSPKN
jgi:Peptidase C65 Otubain